MSSLKKQRHNKRIEFTRADWKKDWVKEFIATLNSIEFRCEEKEVSKRIQYPFEKKNTKQKNWV